MMITRAVIVAIIRMVAVVGRVNMAVSADGNGGQTSGQHDEKHKSRSRQEHFLNFFQWVTSSYKVLTIGSDL